MGKKKSETQEQGVAPSAPQFEEDQHQQSPGNSNVEYPSLNSDSPQTPVVNPSTPPPTYESTNEQNAYIPQTNPMGPQSSSGNDNMPPPPDYNDAMNCCPAPPYLPYGTPKPAYLNGPQTGNPIYPPPISGTGYVLQAPVDNTRGAPQPHVITTTIIASGQGNCIHCYGGEVHNETDLCCLLCLILFAIFTFPMGLVLLCCIPCTTRKRCIRCRRLN